MSRWWRAYDEAVDDPKLVALTDEQHRFWFNILCIFSAFGGSLPEVSALKIKLRMQERKVKRLLAELVAAGLLDDDNGLIKPHNWNGRQYKSDNSTDRVKRFRNGKRNVSGNVSETPPETETETETEKKMAPSAPLIEQPTEEAELYRRGRQVLGKSSGGLITKLVKAKGGSIPLARAAIEQAATKGDASEYIARIVSGPAAAGSDFYSKTAGIL
jgi:hypothetical protein